MLEMSGDGSQKCRLMPYFVEMFAPIGVDAAPPSLGDFGWHAIDTCLIIWTTAGSQGYEAMDDFRPRKRVARPRVGKKTPMRKGRVNVDPVLSSLHAEGTCISTLNFSSHVELGRLWHNGFEMLALASHCPLNGALLILVDCSTWRCSGSAMQLPAQPSSMCVVDDVLLITCGASLLIYTFTFGLRRLHLTEEWIGLQRLDCGLLLGASAYKLYIFTLSDIMKLCSSSQDTCAGFA